MITRETDLRPQSLRRSFATNGTPLIVFTLGNVGPVFPVAGHFREHVAHDLCAGHEAVLLAFKDADFALAHEFAEPADVVGWDTAIFGAVVYDDRAVDILVTESNRLLCL